MILPTHRLLDAAAEKSKGSKKIGSTLKGIGPTYMDKTGRNGIRIGDLELPNWKEKYRELVNKHEELIAFYKVDLTYDLQKLESDFFAAIDFISNKLSFVDSESVLADAQADHKKILAEGAQGSLLDIDFGTYPFVTSSNTTAAGACTGLGVAPNKIEDVFGIFKATQLVLAVVHFRLNYLMKLENKLPKLGMNLVLQLVVPEDVAGLIWSH